MVEKDLKSALEVLTSVHGGSEEARHSELLQAAHQTNVWVLDAAGKHDEAQESIEFLLKKGPDDPLQYVRNSPRSGRSKETELQRVTRGGRLFSCMRLVRS